MQLETWATNWVIVLLHDGMGRKCDVFCHMVVSRWYSELWFFVGTVCALSYPATDVVTFPKGESA